MRTEIRKSRARKLEAACGVCCFIAGILAASLGSLLTASGWITGVEVHPWIRGAGTGLLVVTIPLIIFAGFCLDWAEQGQKKTPRDSKQAQRGPAALTQIAAVATVLGAALLGPTVLHAQQTIFNVPTTDVLDRGKVYVELDASLKPTDGALVPRFSSFVPRVVFGAGSGIEF